MKSGIYTITNTINGKIYIGATRNLIYREQQHFGELLSGKHKNEYLQRAWNKHGKESFIYEILIECEENFLFSEENYWCNLLNVHNKEFGYNIKPTNPFSIGGKISEEGKQKLSKALTNRQFSQSTISKMSLSAKNREISINAIKAASNINKKSVIQFSIEGEIIKEFECAKYVQIELGIAATGITACCRYKYKTYKGFIWRYKNEDNVYKIEELPKNCKKVVIKSDENKVICIYNSINEAALDINSSRSYLGQICIKQRKYKGFYWKTEYKYAE